MATLADAFEKLVAEHGVHYVSVSFSSNRVSRSAKWMACLQWDGFSREPNGCAQCHGSSPEEAIRVALAEMALLRTPFAAEAAPIEIGEAA